MKSTLKNVLLTSTIALSIISLSGCGGNKESTISERERSVLALLKSIETGEQEPASIINPNHYIQHNLAVKDGLSGFAEVLAALPAGSAKVDVKRIFEFGDYVFAHTEYNFFGPKAGFDIFRFENDLIVEHWDNLQPIAEPNPSGHTQFDGETEVRDISNTDENIMIVNEFVESILINGTGDITGYIGTGVGDYIQHNPSVADDLDGLSSALKNLADMGTPMVYFRRHITLGEGNFVLAVSEGEFLGEHVAFYDLFRLNKGKIVEHWDVIETIPEQSQWVNENGKFGFTK